MIINHPSVVKLEINVRCNKEMLAKKCEPPVEIEPSRGAGSRVSPRVPLARVLFTISPKWRACSQATLLF